MPAPSRRPENSRSPWKRAALWGLPAFCILVLVAAFVVKAAAERYLRSDAFRQMIAERAGTTLKARCELAPLHFSGSDIFADGFTAKGSESAAFSDLQIEQVRTEISLRRFFEHVWQVDRFEAQRVKVALHGPRITRPEAPEKPVRTASPGDEGGTSWLPNRVEIGSAIIRDAQLAWRGGALRGTALEFLPHDGGWQVTGQGGRLTHGDLPPLDVQALQLRYRAGALFVNSADLRQPGGGSLQVTGEVNTAERMDLRLSLVNINLSPLLSEDWRVRLKGDVSGEVTVRSPLPMMPGVGPEIAGSLSLSRGELTTLPVLDQIAMFTGTQQFRRLNLTRMSGDFEQDGVKLRVTKFIAESERLIRIEGAFTVENERIEGAFQVGVTPGSLQWLPGSQTKVFTALHDGYAWAPMRLSGSVNHPDEDLSPRLVAAVQGAVIEGAQKAAGDTFKTGTDAIKGALDLLLPGAK